MKEKIPFYNIVNMFFVGAVFSVVLFLLLFEYIPLEKLKSGLDFLSGWSVFVSGVLMIIMYEVGFIINRMGSIVIGTLYYSKKLKLWPREDYGIEVSEIAKKNERFQTLITEQNLMRSQIMMCLLLSVVALCLRKWLWVVGLVSLIIVFTIGGRMHNKKINRIKEDYSRRQLKAKEERIKNKKYHAYWGK